MILRLVARLPLELVHMKGMQRADCQTLTQLQLVHGEALSYKFKEIAFQLVLSVKRSQTMPYDQGEGFYVEIVSHPSIRLCVVITRPSFFQYPSFQSFISKSIQGVRMSQRLPLVISLRIVSYSISSSRFACTSAAMPFKAFFRDSLDEAYVIRGCNCHYLAAYGGADEIKTHEDERSLIW